MAEPLHPVVWEMTTHLGEPVKMVRLLHVDLVRAYQQDPPARYAEHRKDTGYHTLREFEALRDYIHNRFGCYTWQGGTLDEPDECWIWVPATDSPNYWTDKTRWNTILRRWPKFIDPGFTAEQNP